MPASMKMPARAINPKIVSAYREVAAARRTVPEAIALGMVDRRRAILKVETDQGIEFVAADELDALKKESHNRLARHARSGRLAGQLLRRPRPRVRLREAVGQRRRVARSRPEPAT